MSWVDVKPCYADGMKWYPFDVKFKTPEGKTYSFTIYATDSYHAACLVDDIRNTAELDGQILCTGKQEDLEGDDD